MGQAKQRGTREERVAQARKRQEGKQISPPASSPPDLKETLAMARRLEPLFDALSTPAAIDDKVTQFAQELGGKAPIFLDCQPELWSRQSCCDSNVKEFIKLHGGQMLCGYRIWYAQPRYIEGERHAIWTDGTAIRDVSFVDTGEKKIVFVPDERAFDDAPSKVRSAFEVADKQALAAYESLASLVPITRMSPGQAWNMYPTYEAWLAGRRMPNMLPNFKD